MKHLLSLLALTCVFMCTEAKPHDINAALKTLDERIKHIPEYKHKKERHIDSIKALYREAHNQDKSVQFSETLGDEYLRFQADSAVAYYRHALRHSEHGKKPHRHLLRQKLATSLAVTGATIEALNLHESIPEDSLKLSDRLAFHIAASDMFTNISNFYTEDSLISKYHEAALKHLKMVDITPLGNSPDERFYTAVYKIVSGQSAEGIAIIRELLENLPPHDPLYARVASLMAWYYIKQYPDENEATYYLILSADADIQAATLENTALKLLGERLYNKGDINRSYKYLTVAMEQSLESGSKIRTLSNAGILPLISTSQHELDIRKTKMLIVLLIAVGVLALVAVGSLFYMHRTRKRLRDISIHLEETNTLKDSYIQRMLQLCSMYIERLEDFNTLAGRKIKTGQVQDLYQMIESGKILHSQSEKMFEVFDEAFFGIYPDFIHQLNTLLLPDKQISPTGNDKLTPELRLAAFMRLGIDDSTQLSRFLGLSLNTIYTYRNKLKARAISRETFDEDLKKLGRMDK
ncbi:MAG: hypothetical protein K2M79_05655 [Muribaculaceae bacterium]|nr:hypothetical protein [Muribaculaceae bacterium]